MKCINKWKEHHDENINNKINETRKFIPKVHLLDPKVKNEKYKVVGTIEKMKKTNWK
jgi:hypothetical protein